MTLVSLYLKARGLRRLRRGHPWIYRDDLDLERGGAREARSPGLGVLYRPDGAVHGLGMYSPRSRISMRLLERGRGPFDDRDLLATVLDRTRAAIARRISSGGASQGMQRLVSGDADGVPGLVIDRYGDVLVLQISVAAVDGLREEIADFALQELGARAVVERDESRMRRLEGLESRSGVLRGQVEEPLEVVEDSLRLRVDVLTGQKTGAFLDQSENRRAFGEAVAKLRELAPSGAGVRVLDAFCHDGLFGLHALAAGASEVLFLEQSAGALARVRTNLELNGFAGAGRAQVRGGNAFDELRSLRSRGELFDAVVLDPPAFAKSRREVAAASRGYREINAQALRLIRSGGTLWTCSCSYNLSPSDFEGVVRLAAADSGRRVVLAEVRGQASDHPILLTLPESRYLKCLVLRVI